MGDAITGSLPFAVALALSPVPVIATLLMLVARRPGQASLGFMIGWTASIAAVTAGFVFAWGSAETGSAGGSSSRSTVISVVIGVLGLLLLALGVRYWLRRGRVGTARLPGWLLAVDSLSRPRAAGLGVVLCALNPKNLLLCAAAAASITDATEKTREQLATVLVFTLIGAATVTIPVTALLVAGDRVQAPQRGARSWLELNSEAVTGVMLSIVGVVLMVQSVVGLN